ncbi:MAG: GntR family transcriptional regulator [Kineosporiaceae bacterium]|nr:GntR family transcriptional regulator [Kineosporiaceae bacterium]
MTGDSAPPVGLEVPRSLRAQIAAALRGAIVTGQMHPGETYSVPATALRFGVSATPAREAMLDLVKDGLLVAVRNKGFQVPALTEHDLDEITELRVLLEAPTVGRLAGRVGTEDLDRLLELAAQVQRHAEAGDLVQYVEVDRSLHLGLLSLAGNHRLVAMVEQLRDRSRLPGLQALVHQGRLAESAREHLAILSAVNRGDAAVAERLTAAHVRHARGIWAGRTETGAGG